MLGNPSCMRACKTWSAGIGTFMAASGSMLSGSVITSRLFTTFIVGTVDGIGAPGRPEEYAMALYYRLNIILSPSLNEHTSEND